MLRFFRTLLLLIVALPNGQATAADPASLPSERVERVSEDVYRVGLVRLDKKERSVSFPASVNLTNVLLEYAVVGDAGKLHESLLATSVQPYQIHLAMLLLGATNKVDQSTDPALLSGTPITIWVSWENKGEKVQRRLEELICREDQSQPMTSDIWLYTGSRFVDGVFVAQAEQSIVTVIDDSNALVANPRQGRENDEIWFPNEKAVPPVLTPVTVSFKLERAQ